MSREEASAGTGETGEIAAAASAGSGEATAASSTDYVKEYTEATRARDYPKSAYPLKFPVLVAIHQAAFAHAERPHVFIAGKVNSTEIIDFLSILIGDRENIIITTNTVTALIPEGSSKHKFTSWFGEAHCTGAKFLDAQGIFFLPGELESVKEYKRECELNFAEASFYTIHYDAITGLASLRLFNETNLREACAQAALPVAAQKPIARSLLQAIKTIPAPAVSAVAGAGLFVAAPAPARAASGLAATATPALRL